MRRIGRWCRSLSVALACLLSFALAGPAIAQLPISPSEMVRQLNSLPPSQRQALLRELQDQLPPAQREAIVRALQGGGGMDTLDSAAQAALTDALSVQVSTPSPLEQEREEPRLEPGSTIVLQFEERESTSSPGVSEFRERLARGNPYELDSLGRLLLPGIAPIRLAGLTADQATIRIEAEPRLLGLQVVLTLLPLEPVGIEALRPFGYDVFERARPVEAMRSYLPPPQEYVVGPGDSLIIQLFGAQNAESFQRVNNDGTINFPEIGPLNVAGLTFDEARNLIAERVSEQLIGVRVSVTLGELRSIGVFVLGDVKRPGAHTVSGFATITDALFASGGVTRIGSLRNIDLIRNGTTIVTLDFYDFLLRGDSTNDVRLQAGDAIRVPPINASVAVAGDVRRPAIYELKDESSVRAVIDLAGGFQPTANRSSVRIERVVPNRGVTVEDVDLTVDGGSQLRDGDVVRVPRTLDDLQRAVRLAGNVYEPGLYPWKEGMRLRDLLPESTLVRPSSDLNYVLIRRDDVPNVRTVTISADLERAWASDASENIELEPRDMVFVFNTNSGRRHVIDPLLEELQRQAPSNAPTPVVRIEGRVRAPGEYPLEPGMRVSDLLRAGGGMSEEANALEAELSRYVVVGESRETELITVDLGAILRGDRDADVLLSPHDYLNIKEVSRWGEQESVTLRGEVVSPGTYTIRRGETLSSVLRRAGGLTELAFAQGAVFLRRELRQRERDTMEVLASRLERELAAISLSDPSASDVISTGQALLTQLRNARATGRLVIPFDEIVRGEAAVDIVLKHGDELLVPRQSQEVTVLGEVQYATSHLFVRGQSREGYIALSGGLTRRADKGRIFVVRASGQVVADSGAKWFRRNSDTAIKPGDTIVVPLDVEQRLATWTQITQIIYNLAIAAAAVNSF